MAKKPGGKKDGADVQKQEIKPTKLNNKKQHSKEAVTITKVQEKITPIADGSPGQVADDDQKAGDAVSGEATPTIKEATLEFLNPKIFAPIVNSAFDGAAKQWGDHWKLADYERDSLTEALCNYLNVVLPEMMKDNPELVVLGITAGTMIIPRVMQSAKERKKKQKAPSIIPGIHAETGEKEAIESNGQSLPATSL